MTGIFGDPDLSAIPDATPETLAELEAFVEERPRFDMVRGRERGHFYQMTADMIMLDHRADYARRSRDGLGVFRAQSAAGTLGSRAWPSPKKPLAIFSDILVESRA